MDFVCKLYDNTYAVHVTVALVGVATLNLALPAPLSTYKLVKRPLPNGGGNFLNFSSALEETLMMRLITKEKYMSFDSIFWYDPMKFLTVHFFFILPIPCEFECPMSNVQYPANFSMLSFLYIYDGPMNNTRKY